MTQFDLCRQDCVEGMSRLTSESVDLVVTSPPYNLGIGYRQYADRQDRQSYLKWCVKWAAQIRRILRSNGSFFLNVGSAPSNPMLPHQIVIELTSASDGFLLQNTIHWIKSIAVEIRNGFLTIATSTSFTLRSRDELKSSGLPSACPIRTRATSRAGRTLEGPIYVVAATRGSFPTKQFRAARRNDRIQRHFLFNWLNGASNCTAPHESKRCSILSSVLEIPPSPPNAVV